MLINVFEYVYFLIKNSLCFETGFSSKTIMFNNIETVLNAVLLEHFNPQKSHFRIKKPFTCGAAHKL